MTGIFMNESRPTLQAIGAAIEGDASLTATRRGAIRSAINTLCRVMGMSPAMVPADLNFIRRKLQGIGPAAAGVKEKRFSTVKSQVSFALRHLGHTGKGTYLTPMVGDWMALWTRLPDKYARTVLSRFFRYCSARNLDPGNVTDRLFLLPQKIRKEVEQRTKMTCQDALLMQHAVALTILTYAPLRIGNLAALHLERNLHWSDPNMTGSLLLDIDGAEVKNDQTLSFPVPTECADLIRLYLHKYHSRLTPGANPYLFPSDVPGRPKRSDTLGKQLTKLIHRTIGFEVNPHLYRHLVHIIVLNRYPGAYAMVSRVLGHKSLQTAISNYAGEDLAISMRAFQGLVADVVSGGRLVHHDGSAAAYRPNDRGF